MPSRSFCAGPRRLSELSWMADPSYSATESSNRQALSLDGKAAVIFGGSGGIGGAAAAKLAARGAAVGLVARRITQLNDTAGSIRRLGGRCEIFRADVGSAAEVADAIRQCEASFGGLDILVNSGPGGARGSFATLTDDDWLATLDSKILGYVRAIRVTLPCLVRRGGGAIINVAGTGGREPRSQAIAVSAANAAIINLTKALSFDVAPLGVRVNAVSPGPVQTARHEARIAALMAEADIDAAEAAQRLVSEIPLGHASEPNEIAEVVAFLASPASSSVIGSCFIVDGGWTKSAI